MTLLLCLWTKQNRAVFVVIVFLTSLTCFFTAGISLAIGASKIIAYLNHMASFLISASFNMMWLSTTEIFPHKIRYNRYYQVFVCTVQQHVFKRKYFCSFSISAMSSTSLINFIPYVCTLTCRQRYSLIELFPILSPFYKD